MSEENSQTANKLEEEKPYVFPEPSPPISTTYVDQSPDRPPDMVYHFWYDEVVTETGQKWFRSKHRTGDLPAVIVSENTPDGMKVISREWYHHGKSHREGDLPAYEMVHKNNGSAKTMLYSVHGKLHRENDKPAMVVYDDMGNFLSQDWYKNGVPHRDNNQPAKIHTDIKHNMPFHHWWEGTTYEWWEDGKFIRTERRDVEGRLC